MAGATNLIQVNPNLTGAESDSTYASDSIVTGGAIANTRLPAAFFNKFVAQVSGFIAAFAQAFAQKGYTLEDNNFAGMVNVLTQIVTNADNLPKLVSIPYSPNITLNGSTASGWEIQLYGNTTLTLINAAVGTEYKLVLVQGGNGGYAVTWGSGFSGGTQPDTDAGSYSFFHFLTTIDGNARANVAQVDE
jgi:hypothetical protein